MHGDAAWSIKDPLHPGITPPTFRDPTPMHAAHDPARTSRQPKAPSAWLVIPPRTASLGPLAFTIILLVTSDVAWGFFAGLAASVALSLSPLLARWSPWLGRWVGTFGVASWFAIATMHAHRRPLLVLLLGLGTLLAISLLWRRALSYKSWVPQAAIPSSSPALTASLTCVIASIVESAWSALSAASAAISVTLALLLLARSPRPEWQQRGATALCAVALAAALAGSVLVGVRIAPHGVLALSSLGALVAGVVQSRLETSSGQGITDLLLDHPARLLVVTFSGLCIVGTVALSLPWSAGPGTDIRVLDAAFTAVSAACVTGLIVLDTPNAFSGLGQALLLAVIQAGGLGIMTISTSALSLLGRRLSLRQEAVMAALVSRENRADLYGALKRTLGVTVAFELAGAVLLTFAFVWEGDGWAVAMWRGVFTSISAFCNAGFALQSDSLVPYQSNAFILHVVGVLIIAGGLSPVALLALPGAVRGQQLGLQIRIAFLATGVLLVSGFVIVAALEWSASLAGMGWLDRMHNAWFQSVTLRTAGFNSVDFTSLRPATSTIMLAFMFIGGCPGGTAGGLKTTTVFVLLLAVAGSLRGKVKADAFGRTMPSQTVFKAASAATMGVLAVLVALVLLLIAQPLNFQSALFEVVSALGTVGLSTGATGSLDEVGKIVIMVCMFLGRVGPLTVFLILSERRETTSWTLPEEEVEVG